MNNQDVISAYLMGALKPEQMRKFEQEIQANEELRQEVLTMQQFFDGMEYPATPDVIEKVHAVVAENRPAQPKVVDSKKSSYIVIVLSLIALFVLFYFIGQYTKSPNPQGPIVDDALDRTTETFSGYIDSIYTAYPPASNLLRSEGKDTSINEGPNLLRRRYRSAHMAMANKNWVLADSLFGDVQFTEGEGLTVPKDAVSFYQAIARLAVDSCSSSGRTLLSSIPEREVEDFSKLARIVEERVRKLGCK